MEEEEERGRDDQPSPASSLVLALRAAGGAMAAHRAQSLPRHSLLRRVARATRARLGHRLDAAADSLMLLQAEKAMLLFRSGSLEAHISEALSLGMGMGPQPNNRCKFFSKASKLSGGGPIRVCATDDERQLLCLSSLHSVAPKTTVEATVQGSQVQLSEFRLRVVQSLGRLQDSESRYSRHTGKLALTLGTNLLQRHRFTLESMMGCRNFVFWESVNQLWDKHTLSTIISSSFFSKVSWGLASSHKLGKHLTLFSRYSSDECAGQRLILQAVQRLDGRNTISPICSATIGGRMQTGISWTHLFSKSGDAKEEALQLKALYGGKGLYTVTVKVQVGKLED
ncbi:hypothetical protein O6H91_06G045100 [Diphasiastrum complanatum]|uniref:Uncharacterized protein n=1 Tax=Diphasiastrum complanatum TaxID=34168 RepID=A0ACC2DDH3_DIPCM|nr:hypothetical protein O6H91_06G045100 [Diphasiastrum complanatum]